MNASDLQTVGLSGVIATERCPNIHCVGGFNRGTSIACADCRRVRASHRLSLMIARYREMVADAARNENPAADHQYEELVAFAESDLRNAIAEARA